MTKRGPKSVPNVSNAEIYRYYENLKVSLKRYIAGILYPMYINRKSLAYNFLLSISRYPYGDISVISFNYTLPSSFEGTEKGASSSSPRDSNIRITAVHFKFRQNIRFSRVIFRPDSYFVPIQASFLPFSCIIRIIRLILHANIVTAP